MAQTRREFICKTTAVLLSGSLGLICSAALPEQNSPGSAEPRFTPPPGEETPDIKTLIDKAQLRLEGGRANTAQLLSDPEYLPAHQWPRFRTLIRNHAEHSQTLIIAPQEAGEPLVVFGFVKDNQNTPLAGAFVYFYQTSARGWYSDRAPHISGMAGDQKHARLFGYLKTDREGAFEFRTVRPAGYPNSNLPAHIHVEVKSPGPEARTLVSEIRFDDDPRLTAEMRAQAVRERLQVCDVKRDAAGLQSVRAEFRIR